MTPSIYVLLNRQNVCSTNLGSYRATIGARSVCSLLIVDLGTASPRCLDIGKCGGSIRSVANWKTLCVASTRRGRHGCWQLWVRLR